MKEAEKFKGEDEKIRNKIEAKNNLENYLYSVKNTLQDDKMKDKFQENDKKSISEKIEQC